MCLLVLLDGVVRLLDELRLSPLAERILELFGMFGGSHAPAKAIHQIAAQPARSGQYAEGRHADDNSGGTWTSIGRSARLSTEQQA